MEQNVASAQEKAAKEKTLWFPEPYQVVVTRNPNYLKSLFIGLTNPLWNLPTMVIALILFPLIRGLWAIGKYLLFCTLFGIFGFATGLPIRKPRFIIVPGDRGQPKQ